jgi:probable phosphoglycerate mutase
MRQGDVAEKFDFVCSGIDGLLAKYGYIRENGFYRTESGSDKTIVCFCHFAVTSVIMAHMLNISPAVMYHGFFMPTTSVTVLGTEERTPHEVYFRCQLLGDTYHLRAGGEPISQSGYFGEIFRG